MTDTLRPYSLKQALEFTGLTSQALRHWREVLPPLQGRKAHRSGFSARDLLAILVVKAWVDEFGGQVRHLSDHADGLFTLCAEEPWPRMEQSLLVYDLSTHCWHLVSVGEPLLWEKGAIILPIGILAAHLREQLIGEDQVPQKALDFPLMSVDGSASVARGRHRGRVQ